MIYFKNLPVWERLLRIGLGGGFVVYLLAYGGRGPWIWVLVATVVILLLTGLIGFCPACAMVGRRPLKGNAPTEP